MTVAAAIAATVGEAYLPAVPSFRSLRRGSCRTRQRPLPKLLKLCVRSQRPLAMRSMPADRRADCWIAFLVQVSRIGSDGNGRIVREHFGLRRRFMIGRD